MASKATFYFLKVVDKVAKYSINDKNKLLIEKAILKDELKQKTDSFLIRMLKKINHRKKELICDYFK